MKNLSSLPAHFNSSTNSDVISRKTCSGSGSGKNSYTLVFEAGMGNWSVFFKPLAQKLNDHFKIYLTDRPGYDSSCETEDRLDAVSNAEHLKRRLLKAGIEGSVILAGHSMGGLTIRMFQHLYPDKVKGMILIDAANPNLPEKMPEVEANLQEQIKQMKKIKKLASLGVLKFAKRQIPNFGLPEDYLDEYYKVVVKPYYYSTYIRELEDLKQSLEQCKNLPGLQNLPLLVLASKKGLSNSNDSKIKSAADIRWLELQKELALLSSNSLYLESNEDHFLHLSDVDFVAKAIKEFCHAYIQ